jgi:hypothetical protein
MALLGKGALVIWHDPAPEIESEYNEWHSKEHMYERVHVPGFLRGQRGVAITGAPKYFNFYEVEDFATLTSKAYLDRLNDPTPWTRRVAPHMHNNSRTLCRVSASFGAAVPAFWTMILLASAAVQKTTCGHGSRTAPCRRCWIGRASSAPTWSRASKPRAAPRPSRSGCAAAAPSSSTG